MMQLNPSSSLVCHLDENPDEVAVEVGMVLKVVGNCCHDMVLGEAEDSYYLGKALEEAEDSYYLDMA